MTYSFNKIQCVINDSFAILFMYKLEFDISVFVFGLIAIVFGFVFLFFPQIALIFELNLRTNIVVSSVLIVVGVLILIFDKRRIKADLEEERKKSV